jgi:hypothetical protein
MSGALYKRQKQRSSISMKPMRHTTVTRWPVLLALFGLFLTGPSPARDREPPSGISVQTFVHDPWVVNIVTGQVGGTFPFQASLPVYSVRSGRLVSTIMTDSEGCARVSLPPGDYEVVPDTMWQGQVLGPDEVVIGSYETADPIIVRVRGHGFVLLAVIYERAMGY